MDQNAQVHGNLRKSSDATRAASNWIDTSQSLAPGRSLATCQHAQLRASRRSRATLRNAKRQAFKMHPPSAAILPSVRHKAFALNAAARPCTSLTGLSFGRWRRQLHLLVAL